MKRLMLPVHAADWANICAKPSLRRPIGGPRHPGRDPSRYASYQLQTDWRRLSDERLNKGECDETELSWQFTEETSVD